MSDTPSNPTVPTRMTHAADMLRYAAVVAYEHADKLKGSDRDMAFSVLHFIEVARDDVESSLSSLEA